MKPKGIVIVLFYFSVCEFDLRKKKKKSAHHNLEETKKFPTDM